MFFHPRNFLSISSIELDAFGPSRLWEGVAPRYQSTTLCDRSQVLLVLLGLLGPADQEVEEIRSCTFWLVCWNSQVIHGAVCWNATHSAQNGCRQNKCAFPFSLLMNEMQKKKKKKL